MNSGLPPMVELSRIKADLPDWPDEVIEQWLLKVANRGIDAGWPPPDPLASPWKSVLGERPLSWWQDVTWRLEEQAVELNLLSASTKRAVRAMIDAHVNGASNVYARRPGSKSRFLSAARYIAEHGTIPKPLVVMRLPDGFVVIDGNHRVSALCHCQSESGKDGVPLRKAHKLWIGTPPG